VPVLPRKENDAKWVKFQKHENSSRNTNVVVRTGKVMVAPVVGPVFAPEGIEMRQVQERCFLLE
jgi:hypothetical protein